MKLINLVLLLICPYLSFAENSINALNGNTIVFEELKNLILHEVKDKSVPAISFALISDGEVVFNHVAGVSNTTTKQAASHHSIFEAASLSKPVFAFCVMKLAEDNVIDLDKPLYQYLPFDELEGTDERYRNITARMVLSHTSGFPNWRWFDPAPKESGIERGAMYIKKEPGEFTYSGEAYHYLARVLMKLTRKDETNFEDILNKYTKLDNEKDFYWTWRPSLSDKKVFGHKNGVPTNKDWPMSFPDDTPDKIGVAGRLHTNAKAYGQFLTQLFSDKSLRPQSLVAMLSPQSIVPTESYDYKNNKIVAWGLGIGLSTSHYGARYFHGGNNGDYQSGFTVYGLGKIGFVFFTNGDSGEKLHKLFEKVLLTGTSIT